ncbi:MAG: AAC(3) family N-acetyltransferase [Chloroflexota bacterium]|nr:AAC(3) family N-acetyltransferase [Chloroflexota bacterium]MDQ5867292.1 AAC(3) family N-acetyltransferase [Chloroflexota bacterium]
MLYYPPGLRMRQSHVTQSDIVVGLRRLGLEQGAVVEVHSSLSALGRVEGGADAVIDALQEVVGAVGTLVMSAYAVSPPVPLTDEDRNLGITWKVRWLPGDTAERTGIGVVADAFRQRPDVVCGTTRFCTCAWGRDAGQHCEGYRNLLDVDGWCLLMGVGIDRCSSMHQAEDVPLPAQVGSYFEVPPQVQQAYDPQLWSIGYGGTPDDAWQKVYAEADRLGMIRHGQIGKAMCHLFKANSVVSIYRAWRQTDPFGLYGVPQDVPQSGDLDTPVNTIDFSQKRGLLDEY